jgi:hypothetical protein
MGDAFVGLVHPCKIYNILGVGAPVLYIGPRPSHLSDMLDVLKELCASSAHGDVAHVVAEIERLRGQIHDRQPQAPLQLTSRHSKQAALPGLTSVLESI